MRLIHTLQVHSHLLQDEGAKHNMLLPKTTLNASRLLYMRCSTALIARVYYGLIITMKHADF